MDLVHRFSVQAPIDEAWYALNHIDRLAPCFPGASIDSFDGDDFTGSVRIKFGPTLNYKGSGTFVERDDAAHRAVVEARGSDLRGGSGVLAKVYVEMWENGRLTDIEIKTDLGISGRPAQLGRGVIEDVSNKLLLTFADRVQEGFEAGIGRPGYVAPPPPLPPTMGPEPKRAEAAGAGAAPGGQAASAPEAGPGEPAGTIGRHRYPRTSLADAGAAPAAAAGNGARRRNGKQPIPKRRPHRERADDILVDSVPGTVHRLGDGASDKRAARGALDPRNLAAWAALPPEQRRCFDGGRCRARAFDRLNRAEPASLLDPFDHLVQRGRDVSSRVGRRRLSIGFGRPRCRRLHVGLTSHLRVQRADETAGLRVRDFTQRRPLVGLQARSSEHGRRHAQRVRSKIFEQP